MGSVDLPRADQQVYSDSQLATQQAGDVRELQVAVETELWVGCADELENDLVVRPRQIFRLQDPKPLFAQIQLPNNYTNNFE